MYQSIEDMKSSDNGVLNFRIYGGLWGASLVQDNKEISEFVSIAVQSIAQEVNKIINLNLYSINKDL